MLASMGIGVKSGVRIGAVDGFASSVTFVSAVIAIVASVGGGVRLVARRASKPPALTVLCAYAFMVFEGGRTGPEMLSLTVTNTGERPITIVGAGLRIKDLPGRVLTFAWWKRTEPHDLPCRLEVGAHWQGYTDRTAVIVAELRRATGRTSGHRVRAFVRDSTGQEHDAEKWMELTSTELVGR